MPNLFTTRQSIGLLWLRTAVALLICQHDPVDATAQAFDAFGFDRAVQQEAMGYQWLRWSSEHIGHRLTGSAQGARAEDLADSLFRASALPVVSRFPFAAQAWSRGTIQLTVNDPTGAWHVQAVALANTPLEALVEAPIVDAGNGLPADLDSVGDRAKGAALLVNLGLIGAPEGARNLHRSEKAALAMGRGAALLLFVNHVEGHILLTGTASIDGALIPVPAASIATEDGKALRERLVRGEQLTARLAMGNQSRRVSANNIIAEIPGARVPEEVILIGGHLDCWDLATGATDNGLGSFSILDLARAMSAMEVRPERTVRFVLFMGEEQGLLGSRALVDEYARSGELAHVKCMINLDMSGHPQGFGIAGPQGWGDLVARISKEIALVDSAAFAGTMSEEVWLHSDHQPFLLRGVPVIYPLSDLGKHVYGCYHSSCDDIHLVDPQAMVDNVRFVGQLVYRLASSQALPPHFTEESLRARLIDAGLEQPLRIGGDWPW
ncbi:MAG: M28 family peptidase [Flavobacteriales bacterium]|nr:M28 family peptidase [Flavobacteriales bacterium]